MAKRQVTVKDQIQTIPVPLTMLIFQSVALKLVCLVLSLLLEPARPAGQLVLLLATLAARVERHVAHRGQIGDDLAQLVQLLSDGRQLAGIRSQVIAITTTSLAAGVEKRGQNK